MAALVVVAALLVLAAALIPTALAVELAATSSFTQFAFGSCNPEDRPQLIWEDISMQNPQLWVWLGDAIYSDKNFYLYRTPATEKEAKAKYDSLKTPTSAYRRYILNHMPVVGVWDDHDYGINNGDASFALKNKSKELYLDFLEEPKNSARRSQQGVYASYTLGVSGEMVKFILLDNRFAATRGPTSADRDDMLGPEQWAWLENELATNTAQLTFIGSGVQIVSWGKVLGEGWHSFPQSRRRLFSLISKGNPALREGDQSAFFIMSGDVHFAEGSRTHFATVDSAPSSPSSSSTRIKVMPLFDLTSSGLTHSYHDVPIPSFVTDMFFPTIARQYFTTVTPSASTGRAFYTKHNFAMIRIDWKSKKVHAEIHGEGKKAGVVMTFEVTFDDLKAKFVTVAHDTLLIENGDEKSEGVTLQKLLKAAIATAKASEDDTGAVQGMRKVQANGTSSVLMQRALEQCLEEEVDRQVRPRVFSGSVEFIILGGWSAFFFGPYIGLCLLQSLGLVKKWRKPTATTTSMTTISLKIGAATMATKVTELGAEAEKEITPMNPVNHSWAADAGTTNAKSTSLKRKTRRS